MFAGKTIIVTGASKGIGSEIARLLVARGASVVLVARTASHLENLRASLVASFPAARVLIHPLDVGDPAAVVECVDRCVRELGSLDGVVSNAGYAYPEYFERTPLEEFHEQVRINYLGAVHMAKAAHPHLGPGSFLAFTSSVLGYMGCFGYSSYSPTKFALMGLAECLRQEFAEKGIHVCVLCPPDTLTPGFEKENLTKPKETTLLSAGVTAMAAHAVAEQLLLGIERNSFLIHCNLSSHLIYRLKSILPDLSQRLTIWMLARIRRKNHLSSQS